MWVFFGGSGLPDPAGLLEGTGKFMRHDKLKPGQTINKDALNTLISTAYTDMKGLLDSV